MLRRDRLAAAFVLVAGAALLCLGAAMTGAGIERVRAEAFMSHWAEQGAEPEAAAWQAAQRAASTAVARYPVANGDYEDRLGRVYLWRHYRHDFGAETARESRQQAVAALQRSVAARPVAPGTQARLARAHLYLQQLEAPLARHMALARAQGPWNRDVNRELAEVGLVAWPSLAPAQRRQAMEAYCAAQLLPAAQQDPLPELARRVGAAPVSCQNGRYVRPG